MLTGPVQAGCSTRLVSRAEVVAEPPAVQLPSAFTQHAGGRRRAAIVAACGCWSVTALDARENAWRECLVSFGRSKACDLWQLEWGSQEFAVP